VENTAGVAKRLWTLCNVLRDDGITYHQYISELTLILFFKLADQLGVESDIPAQYRWQALIKISESELLDAFKEAIYKLGLSRNQTIRDLFANNETRIRRPESLERLVHEIDKIDWQSIEPSSIGDIYESLIDRNAQESRYGAGQYFTPRALVDAMVKVMAPTDRDSVYDPAAGTAGFLIAAGLHAQGSSAKSCALKGNELVTEVHRLGQMNLHLHGLQADFDNADTLAVPPEANKYSLCLSNPPFGIRSDLNPTQREHLKFATSNKQLNFLQHIYSSLAPGGRAAVVVPDNVLFENGTASAIRTFLLDNYNLHTILRLPTGIFYATGVKTSVLFFSRTDETRVTWVYDLRLGRSGFTRRRPLEIDDLSGFIESFGPDPMGTASRNKTPEFQRFSRDALRDSEDRLDILGRSSEAPRNTTAAASLDMITRELDQASAAAKALQAILERAG
jgi:type I restriction enzyme M protein